MNLKATLLAIAVTSACAPVANAQGTAFTYQGQLDTSGVPVHGTYDLTFGIYTNLAGGGAVGAVLTNLNVSITNGLFTTTLDFSNAFNTGAACWLEIGVRTNGGGAFTLLSPRQSITPAPYAVTAGNLSGTVSASRLTGALPAGTAVPDSALSNDVQLQYTRYYAFAGSGVRKHAFVSSNTFDGSTMVLAGLGSQHYGSGYAGLDFVTAPDLDSVDGSQTLWFSLGMSVNLDNFPYGQPFLESYYLKNSFYFVGSNQILGGLYCTPTGQEGDWVWFWSGQTNTPMVHWSRSAKTLSNYVQATFESNVTLHGAATLIAPNATITNGVNLPAGSAYAGPAVSNGAAQLWNSNSYVYLRTSRNGATNFQDVLIASPP